MNKIKPSSKTMSTASNQCSTEEFDDSRLRSIHRRRAGMCQPKDNLGVNWMDHDNGDSYLHSSRRRVINIPHDNIGNGCLPTNEGGSLFGLSTQESQPKLDGENGSRHQTINLPDENVKLKDDEKKSEAKKLNTEIGISNIKRPSDDPVKMRKPIIPKDNITACGQFIEKSSSRTSWTSPAEKTAAPEKKMEYVAPVVEVNKSEPIVPENKTVEEEDEEEDEYYEF